MHLPPDSVFKPNGSEPTWQTSMLYSDIVPLIYVSKTICMVICPSTRFKSIVLWPGMNHLVPGLSQNAIYGWGAWCHSEFLRHSFLFINRLWVCFIYIYIYIYIYKLYIYNIQLKNRRGVLFCPLLMTMTEAFSISFIL